MERGNIGLKNALRVMAVILFALVMASCEKKDSKDEDPNPIVHPPDTATPGFPCTDTFYKQQRVVLYREDFDSLGNWTLGADTKSDIVCRELKDTAVAKIDSGLLVLKPAYYNLFNQHGVGDIYATSPLPSIKMDSNKAYGIEIKFKTFFRYIPPGHTAPAGNFHFSINGKWIRPSRRDDAGKFPGTNPEQGLGITDGVLHICIYQDSIHRTIDTPNQFLNRYHRYIVIDTTTAGNSAYFSGQFINSGPDGCETASTIVDYFEIYEIQ